MCMIKTNWNVFKMNISSNVNIILVLKNKVLYLIILINMFIVCYLVLKLNKNGRLDLEIAT